MKFKYFSYLYPIKKDIINQQKIKMMSATAEILKNKIENFSPDALEAFAKMMESFEEKTTSAISKFHRDEILYRIQFHNENPSTKLDFHENISELKKYCA